MGTHPHREAPDLSPTREALRRQLEADRSHTPEEQAEIEAAHEDWARQMEQLDAAYEAMLAADPSLRQRLSDQDAVLAALLDAVAEDRSER